MKRIRNLEVKEFYEVAGCKDRDEAIKTQKLVLAWHLEARAYSVVETV